MRYTLRQLQYFAAAAETGSITLGAEKIGISQPSISAAISTLEREFGVQLFIRHHAQGLSLTAVGQRLFVEAKHLLTQAEALYAVASEAAGQVAGKLAVGCMVTMAPMIMPELAQTFLSAFPKTEIQQIEAGLEWLLDALLRAEIDIAVTYDLQIPDGVTFTPLTRLPPYVMVGAMHPLAEQSTVTLEQLADLPLILLDLPISRDYFLSLFTKRGLVPRIQSRSAQQDVVRTMVANGYGYTLANVRPRSDLALDGRRLLRLRLTGDHQPMVMGTAVLATMRKTRLLSEFEAHCRACISDSYIPGMTSP
ncbi:LysR family transcriptional regulator [Acidisoma cellulosilytica]|uniref:LysR family transcriptional regulator n=1 Tax=Acidisoma cellulosilyticum TaxID=2802395 RepID=A0A964E686_9PROT|nr:LysR family transcriptional regulator [Acidisoma cellulosilyticum]MCB8883334.1 LysR family transcriptional regulator [Acidisoma cellulosilyticum]